ncbi:hypothetical protein SAMN06296386_11018 [Lachnospiraceae bacterium]|nr:hypothetical protein SAMN06296386_11018 [Lachnospiraceae bacterium]
MKIEQFYEWEKAYELLNNRSIDGFQYWNYMRRDMVMSFKDELAKVEPAFFRQIKDQAKEGLVDKIKTALVFFSELVPRRIPKADVLFLCHARRQEIDGKMVSIYTDYVAEKFPGSVTIQVKGLGKYKREKLYSENLFFLDKISICGYIYRYLKKYLFPKKYRQVHDQIKNEIEQPFKDLRDNYGFHPNLNEFSDRATVLYYLYRYKRKRYENILKKVSPKVIVEVVGGSFDVQIFNEAAEKLHIPTIELQHGTIRTTYPDNVRIRQFPDYFYSFGNFWNGMINLPIPDDHVVSTGFPYHDKMMESYPLSKCERDKNTVLFLSSRKYGKELSELAVKISRLKPELKIIYKLHPREVDAYKESYIELQNSDIEVIADNKTPLYDLFSRSSMQVGVESTAIYEGMGFNLDTFIWDIPMAASLLNLVESGYAKLFSDEKEFVSLLESRESGHGKYDISDFWKENSMENIVSGINSVMNQ